MSDNDRLSVIKKLEKTSEDLKAAASSMRHELVADGADVEKVKEVLRQVDWEWGQVSCRVAGYPSSQSCPLTTMWLEIPEIQEQLKNILQHAYPEYRNVSGNISLSKEFSSPKVSVYLGGGRTSWRIEFDDLEEFKSAIYDGTVRVVNS